MRLQGDSQTSTGGSAVKCKAILIILLLTSLCEASIPQRDIFPLTDVRKRKEPDGGKETEHDDRYVNVSGDTMEGDLDFNGNFIEDVGYIQLDVDYSDGSVEGRIQWNQDDGTPEVGMPGGNVTGQILQEMIVRATNDTGSLITNGTPVYISDTAGKNVKVSPADADFDLGVGFRTFGVATEDIIAGQKGYVTTQGYVRDIDTTFAPAANMPAYLAVGGGFSTSPPAAPDVTIFVGVVTVRGSENGEMYVIQTSIPNLNSLSDVEDSPTDGDILNWDNATKVWKTDAPTIEIPISLTSYDAQPARTSESNIHGGLLLLTAGTVSVPTNTQLGPTTPGDDISVSKGIGKILVVVDSGADVAGTITITGEKIDRDTGASTPAHENTITVDAVTVDNSSDDSNGNRKHAFTGAYISADWFTGTVVLSSTTLDCFVHVYHLSFEQFNDNDNVTVNTFDVNLFTTNSNAEFDAYLFDLHVESASKCNIENHAELHIGADGETAIANKYWRLRRGNISQRIDGSTDGVWLDVHYSNPGAANIEDVTTKIWATKTQTLIFEEAPPSDLLLETGDSLLLETGDKLLLES